MPFDGTDFDPSPPPPRPRRLSKRGESMILVGAALILALLLILPISADALIDLVHYLRGR